MATLHLHIITPLGTVLLQEVSFVVVPTLAGEVTVRPGHIPLISVIKAGELVLGTDESRVPFSVFSGVLEVKDTETGTAAILLVDRSEKAEDIDIERAEASYKRAEELRAMATVGNTDFAHFEKLMNKELNRVNIARKYR
jgi:F-type H+-transporting ATPase subunit epsilon